MAFIAIVCNASLILFFLFSLSLPLFFLFRYILCEMNRKCVDTSCNSCADYRAHFRSRSLENHFSKENALKRWKRGHWFPSAGPRRWCSKRNV